MSDYGFGSRLLHRVALGSSFVAEASFDFENMLHGRAVPKVSEGQHVFVTGLARSGTTILMRALFESGAFCSLTYRDMPFVLAPNFWAKIADRSRRRGTLAERSHADGILVDFDSPEALEEVFWRIFCSAEYIAPQELHAMKGNKEVVEKFRSYVALILNRYGGRRYLSKNNNNILRLQTIREAFPKARILVPYRHPEQQAYSLLKQHLMFCDLHREDRFAQAYMTWLVHHEFGANHRPFAWGRELAEGLSPDTIDYWLAQWIGVYAELLAEIRPEAATTQLVCYDELCTRTDRIWPCITAFLELNTGHLPNLQLRRAKAPAASPTLRERSLELYEQLNAQMCRKFRTCAL